MDDGRRGRWGERTIRHGTIRWHGHTYRVTTRPAPDLNGFQEPAYDGSLDGQRASFYEYADSQLDGHVYVHSLVATSEPPIHDGRVVWDDWVREEAARG